jgi:hypothetical protein
MTLLAIHKSPFLERDGGVRLKLGGALGVVIGVFAMWGMSGGMMLTGASPDELAGWRDWDPPGRPLAAFGLQLMIFIIGGAGTILGAVSIAEERDRGTWREIMLTPMTPGDIILGKAAALTTTLLPFAILSAPVIAWGALVGDVGVVDVLLATGFGLIHVPFFTALGLAVSAHASSVRQATTTAVIAFMAVGVMLVFVPGSVLVGQIADLGLFPTFVPEALAQVSVVIVGTFGCLMVARERIAARGENGYRARRPLVFALLALPPTLLVLPLLIRRDITTSQYEIFEMASVALVGTAALAIVALTVLLDVASSPTPRRTAIIDGALAAMSLLVGGITMAHVAPGLRDLALDGSSRFIVGVGIGAPFAATAFALASITALIAARRGRSAMAAFGALSFIVTVIVLGTAIGVAGSIPAVDGIAGALLCMNPFVSATSLVESTLVSTGLNTLSFAVPPQPATVASGLAVQLLIAVVGLALAGNGRRAA